MLTRGDRFLQGLEGPKEAVENAFIRIIRDPRHHGVILLSRRLVTRREFGGWEMAHYDSFAAHEDILAHVEKLTQGASAEVRDAFSDMLWMGDAADTARRRFS